MRMSSHAILDEIDDNFYLEKAEVSTCQNYQMTQSKRGEPTLEEDGFSRIRPLTKDE